MVTITLVIYHRYIYFLKLSSNLIFAMRPYYTSILNILNIKVPFILQVNEHALWCERMTNKQTNVLNQINKGTRQKAYNIEKT